MTDSDTRTRYACIIYTFMHEGAFVPAFDDAPMWRRVRALRSADAILREMEADAAAEETDAPEPPPAKPTPRYPVRADVLLRQLAERDGVPSSRPSLREKVTSTLRASSLGCEKENKGIH